MNLYCLLTLMLFPLLHLNGSLTWQNDYASVLSSSKELNRPILLFFNGSDWAGSAMKMKHEILDNEAFQKKIGDAFCYMEVDFPKHTQQKLELTIQNEELKKRFHVQGFPSMLVLDAQERVIAHISYLPQTPEQFASELLDIVRRDGELIAALSEIKGDHFPQERLRALYDMAQELGSGSAAEQILEKGVQMKDPYFCLEKYRLLVESGARSGDEALKLRAQLLSVDPMQELVDGQSLGFTLALIDFQDLSQNMCSPDISATPLKEYLAQFSAQDKKNIWRIEMMIAELYLDFDCWEEALEHAQKAYTHAPDSSRKEISHSLDYIRSMQSSLQVR